jgi:BCD family chlorophyll transporter-like MFS transporter
MLLLGTIGSALLFSWLLADFSYLRLIKVIQGAAIVTIVLNTIALWRQETLRPERTAPDIPRPTFNASWRAFVRTGRTARLLLAIGLGTAGFSHAGHPSRALRRPGAGHERQRHDGAQRPVGHRHADRLRQRIAPARPRRRPVRMSGYGAVLGLFAFAAVILAAPLQSALLFKVGACLIGVGGGFFAVGTLTAAMDLGDEDEQGPRPRRLGGRAGHGDGRGGSRRWRAARRRYASCGGGPPRPGPADPVTGYGAVYHIEILLLFAALIALGPLVRGVPVSGRTQPFGLQEFPS